MKKETLMIRFLYGTTPGRAILRLLVRPTVSRKVGKFLDSRFSRCLVPLFIKKHHIDMKDYEDRLYVSFNDFFTRKRCVERIDITPKHLISPCDGYLSVYPVEENLTYRIKHVEYSLERLVNSRDLAEQFAGGTCLIFRLTPQDYHRYCYVCDGIRTESGAIGGVPPLCPSGSLHVRTGFCGEQPGVYRAFYPGFRYGRTDGGRRAACGENP